MRVALALLILCSSLGSAHAQDAVPVSEVVPKADPSACRPAMAKTLGLLRGQHNVDAHLIAQTMALLCPVTSPEWDLLDALALTRLEEHQRAYHLLQSLSLDAGPIASRAGVLAAWSLAKGGFSTNTAVAALSRQDAARVQVFARLHRGDTPGKQVDMLSTELQRSVTEGYARLEEQQSKRPWLAGLLSAALPGLGQVYAGSWQSAGVSLVINGVLIASTVELARNDLYFAAATTGMASSIFYVGNILNAADLAGRYNETASMPQKEQLERLLVPEASP